MRKVYCWKAIDKNNIFVEIKIPKCSHKQAENDLVKVCNRLEFTPLEYLGWEE